MSSFRIAILLLVCCAVGLLLAGIRIEKIRCVARIQQLQLRQIALQQRLNDVQLRIARLRSPEQIRNRVERIDDIRVRDDRMREVFDYRAVGVFRAKTGHNATDPDQIDTCQTCCICRQVCNARIESRSIGLKMNDDLARSEGDYRNRCRRFQASAVVQAGR